MNTRCTCTSEKLSKKQIKKGGKPWITKGIKVSIRKRDEFLKSSIKETDITSKKELFTKYKFCRNQIVKLTRKSKTNHYKRYFSANMKNSKNIWKGVNELIDNKKSRKIALISLNIRGTGYF